MDERTANPEQGEVELRLWTAEGGRAFILRPTFEAMVEIERQTGLGLLALARKTTAFELGFGEATAIVTAGLKAAGEGASYGKVGEMVFKTGLTEVIPAITAFLSAALSGGQTVGEAKAAEGS